MDVELFLEQARKRGVTPTSLVAHTEYRAKFQDSAKQNVLAQLDGIAHIKSMFDEDAKNSGYELNHYILTRMLGSGSAMGQAFHQLFSEQCDNNQTSQEMAYLWILVQAYLDDVLDEYEGLDKELLLYISDSKIRQYLKATNPPIPDPFIGVAKSPLVVFTLSLCSLLFKRMNALPGRSQNPKLYQALVNISVEAFTGEVKTLTRIIGTNICPKALHQELVARCIGPFIAIAQSIALTGFDYEYPPNIDAIVYDIASLFRYIDDTTDLEDDIASGTWNSCMVDYLKDQYPDKYTAQVDISFFKTPAQFESTSLWCTQQIFVIYDRVFKRLSNGPKAWQDSADKVLHLSVSHVLSQQD